MTMRMVIDDDEDGYERRRQQGWRTFRTTRATPPTEHGQMRMHFSPVADWGGVWEVLFLGAGGAPRIDK